MVSVSDALSDPRLAVMDFLNEVTLRHPQAISFAPGVPLVDLSELERYDEHIERFVEYAGRLRGSSHDDTWRWLGRYGPTNGIINELVALHLERDFAIRVDPRAIVVTNGAQEAMSIFLNGTLRPREDVLLVNEPSYIGIYGIARLLGVEMVPVPASPHGLDLDALRRTIAQVRASGRNPRALYDVPDFHNPLGTSLGLADRHALLELAAREQILVVEDAAYSMFAYDAPALPTLKALDSGANVVHVGTFSKTVFPALRIGFLVADQPVAGGGVLAEVLSKVKSNLSINTSPLTQALAGGILLENAGSLQRMIEPRRLRYRDNRDRLLQALDREFGKDPLLANRVSWSRPGGGFFLTLELPFSVPDEDIDVCAKEHGVLFCPLRWFCASGRENELRLSFSSLEPDAIDDGVSRLARYVRSR
jgi:(S)-3,5-dihydroxyphenylglycine transaminase